MKWLKLSRITASVLGLMGVFLVVLTLATLSLLWSARQADLADSENQAVRFASGAQAALNRNLLAVDVLLASMDDLLGISSAQADWIDPKASSRLMFGAVQQNLLVRYVALLDGQARPIASSDPRGAGLLLNLPTGFADAVLAQPISTLMVSAPVQSFASGDRVLYFARALKLGDGTRVLSVAEVPVPLLASILIQGVDISGLEVTLERGNGQLLASVPDFAQRAGQQLTPPLGKQPPTAGALRLPARITGAPALLVTRPTLNPEVLIAASIPIEAALENYYLQRQFIGGAALVFALMILAAGGFATWYFDRLSRARQAIARSKATLDQALESMVNGFLLINANKEVVSWNRRFEEMFPELKGLMTPMITTRRCMELTAIANMPGASDAERLEWVEARVAQQANPQTAYEQVQPDGRVIQFTEQHTPDGGLVAIYHDISELRRATAEVEILAFYDPLTHLPNRRLLMDRIQQAMVASARSGLCGALLFLDLDHFKTLNDTLGHDVGDQLLQQVAQRLKACVREEDTVARLGGDEFVVMLVELSAHNHEAAVLAKGIADKILMRLNQPYQLAAHTYLSTPSIGVTLFDELPQAPTELLTQADIAMYEVKKHGRNALCFFDPKMQSAIMARAQMEQDLQTALVNGQFVLYYQPQFERDDGMVGAEVLIRWQHPVRGLVPPVDFIPLAEESDLIVHIGLWVLRSACQQLAHWQEDSRCRESHLSVNVSARQFRQPDFVAQVAAVVRETGVRADLLKLELTESLVLDNIDDTIAKMTELRELGVRFSMDDFGTGHSSLAYLTRLPMDQLKIDRSFVHNIGIQHTDGVIVQTIIGMARNLGLEVIAEGVETQAQQEFLAQHGCTLYQGYRFGKPTPLAGFEALLAR